MARSTPAHYPEQLCCYLSGCLKTRESLGDADFLPCSVALHCAWDFDVFKAEIREIDACHDTCHLSISHSPLTLLSRSLYLSISPFRSCLIRLGANLNLTAVAQLRGDSKVTGSVTFEQADENSNTTISWNITGSDTNAERGMHVHQFGDNTNGCTSAGPHCENPPPQPERPRDPC